MKKYISFGIIIVTLIVIVAFRVAVPRQQAPEPGDVPSLVPSLPHSPLDATYRIDDREVTLTSGLSSEPVAPGSAALDEVRVWGEPVTGDINGDGRDDVALILTESSGGSGTFFYVTAALAGDDSGYIGLNAIPLGDRIAMKDVSIHDEIISANYADRAPGQSFADAPSEAVTARVTLVGSALVRSDDTEKGAQVLAGTLVYGHEARTFTPCGEEAYWIATSSPSRAALEAIYAESSRGKDPYTPVYLVVTGIVGDRIPEGFAADFAHSISISRILSAPEHGTCAGTSTAPAVPEQNPAG